LELNFVKPFNNSREECDKVNVEVVGVRGEEGHQEG